MYLNTQDLFRSIPYVFVSISSTAKKLAQTCGLIEVFIITSPRWRNAKFYCWSLVPIMLAGLLFSAALSSLQSTITIPSSGTISVSPGLHYPVNAVWIMNAAWSGFPTNKQYVLTNHLAQVVSDLSNNHINMAFIFVGYWTPSATLTLTLTDAQITTIVNAFHAAGIQVLAWAESYPSAMDVSASNRNNLYSVITNLMNKGFDGYHDDIEDFTTTLQDWIDYENGCATLVHGMGKLMTAAVAFDWQQNVNRYLHMDYIVSMFYGAHSTFEDSQAAGYWQEDFGEYGPGRHCSDYCSIGVFAYDTGYHRPELQTSPHR